LEGEFCRNHIYCFHLESGAEWLR